MGSLMGVCLRALWVIGGAGAAAPYPLGLERTGEILAVATFLALAGAAAGCPRPSQRVVVVHTHGTIESRIMNEQP
jgi:hypothetical protein